MDQSAHGSQQAIPGCSKNMPMTDNAVAGGSSSSNTYKNPVPSCSKNVSFAPTNSKKDDENNHKLFLIVYKFLQQQMAENDSLSALQKESLEVTIQCLGYAFQFYEFDNPDNNLQTLYEFFEKHKNEFAHKKYEMDSDSEHEITPEDIVKAEEFKEKGNQFMREEKFQEALECYDKAIRLNPDEPALYCNRAATYNNLKKFNEAIEDCNMALSLNRSYAKAYIRKGFAYERLKNNKKALKSYKKACQLEPENEHYKNLYNDASKRLKQKQDESTSTYNTMFLGPSVSSLPFAQLPEFDNLMQSLFSSVERQ